ncbi:hypothetical protein ACKWTF_010465 [Chironomus riparius]
MKLVNHLIVLIILIAFCDKTVSQQKYIRGYNSQNVWTILSMRYCTFNVLQNETIYAQDFMIFAKRSETTEAISFEGNKKIAYLPIKVYNVFPNLVAYEVFDCSLRAVKRENFERLDKLQFVGLQQNQLRHIPYDTFRALIHLQHIHLYGNELTYVEERTFETLENLRSINMKENLIDYIYEGIFDNLIELRNVSLSNNNIRVLNENHFKNNKNIEYIWMSRNKIQELSSKTFDNMRYLKYIDLRGNPCISGSYRVNKFKEMVKRIDIGCKPRNG